MHINTHRHKQERVATAGRRSFGWARRGSADRMPPKAPQQHRQAACCQAAATHWRTAAFTLHVCLVTPCNTISAAGTHLLLHHRLGGAAGRARRRRHGAHQLRELRPQRLAQAAGLPDEAEHGGALFRLAPSKVDGLKAVTPNERRPAGRCCLRSRPRDGYCARKPLGCGLSGCMNEMLRAGLAPQRGAKQPAAQLHAQIL